MNVADLAGVLLYCAMTAALGGVFLRLARAPALLCSYAPAYLAGQLIWLVCLLVLGWCRIAATPFVWGLGLAAIAASMVLYRRSWRRAISVDRALVLLVVAVVLPHAVYMVLRVPLVEWDARSIWFFHGKAIWQQAGVSADFFGNRGFAWSHTDYPLLLPVQAAVVGLLRGAWSEMAVKGFLFANFLAYFSLLMTVLRRRGWPRYVSLGVSTLVMAVMLERYLNGYADNHYILPLVLVALLAFRAAPDVESSAMAGLLLAFVVNMKNEAAVYAAVGVVGWLVLRRWRRPAEGRTSSWTHGRTFALGVLLLGGLPFLLWVLFKTTHGVEGDLELASRLADPAGTWALLVPRTPMILKAMGIIYVRTYAYALLGAVVGMNVWWYIIARRSGPRGGSFMTLEEKCLWGAVLVAHALIFTIYWLTPHDVRWHLGTSLDRLILLPVLLAVGTLIVTAEKVMGYENEERT